MIACFHVAPAQDLETSDEKSHENDDGMGARLQSKSQLTAFVYPEKNINTLVWITLRQRQSYEHID